jgi:hypothetical protein
MSEAAIVCASELFTLSSLENSKYGPRKFKILELHRKIQGIRISRRLKKANVRNEFKQKQICEDNKIALREMLDRL